METPEPSDTTRASKQVSKLKEKLDPDNHILKLKIHHLFAIESWRQQKHETTCYRYDTINLKIVDISSYINLHYFSTRRVKKSF